MSDNRFKLLRDHRAKTSFGFESALIKLPKIACPCKIIRLLNASTHGTVKWCWFTAGDSCEGGLLV